MKGSCLCVATAGVLRAHFRWLQGEENLASFESSPGKLRHFCSICGSHLVAERLGQPNLIVRMATLDEAPDASPQMHIWTSHDQPWLAYENIPAYPEWQPGR